MSFRRKKKHTAFCAKMVKRCVSRAAGRTMEQDKLSSNSHTADPGKIRSKRWRLRRRLVDDWQHRCSHTHTFEEFCHQECSASELTLLFNDRTPSETKGAIRARNFRLRRKNREWGRVSKTKLQALQGLTLEPNIKPRTGKNGQALAELRMAEAEKTKKPEGKVREKKSERNCKEEAVSTAEAQREDVVIVHEKLCPQEDLSKAEAKCEDVVMVPASHEDNATTVSHMKTRSRAKRSLCVDSDDAVRRTGRKASDLEGAVKGGKTHSELNVETEVPPHQEEAPAEKQAECPVETLEVIAHAEAETAALDATVEKSAHQEAERAELEKQADCPGEHVEQEKAKGALDETADRSGRRRTYGRTTTTRAPMTVPTGRLAEGNRGAEETTELKFETKATDITFQPSPGHLSVAEVPLQQQEEATELVKQADCLVETVEVIADVAAETADLDATAEKSAHQGAERAELEKPAACTGAVEVEVIDHVEEEKAALDAAADKKAHRKKQHIQDATKLLRVTNLVMQKELLRPKITAGQLEVLHCPTHQFGNGKTRTIWISETGETQRSTFKELIKNGGYMDNDSVQVWMWVVVLAMKGIVETDAETKGVQGIPEGWNRKAPLSDLWQNTFILPLESSIDELKQLSRDFGTKTLFMGIPHNYHGEKWMSFARKVGDPGACASLHVLDSHDCSPKTLKEFCAPPINWPELMMNKLSWAANATNPAARRGGQSAFSAPCKYPRLSSPDVELTVPQNGCPKQELNNCGIHTGLNFGIWLVSQVRFDEPTYSDGNDCWDARGYFADLLALGLDFEELVSDQKAEETTVGDQHKPPTSYEQKQVLLKNIRLIILRKFGTG